MPPDDMSAVLTTLRSIEARLARLEKTVEPLKNAEEVPKLVGTATDMADEWAERVGDADQRLLALAGLLERASEPKTLRNLHSLVDVADSVPGQLATFADILDESLDAAQKEGVDLAALVPNAQQAALGALKMLTAPEFSSVIDSGMLNPVALRVLGLAARSLERAGLSEPDRLGFFGVMRALKRPHTQRAIGFAMRFAEQIGAALEQGNKQLTSGKQKEVG